MPPEIVPDPDDYASSDDSDFAPDVSPAHASDNSSDDESDLDENTEKEAKKPKSKAAKRKRGQDEEAEDAGFENSGDEAIIERGLKKQRRKKGKVTEDEDEGGEGGLVKTRSMRAQEKVERRPLVDTTAATVDVDALWESMISGSQNAREVVPSITEPASAFEIGTSLNPDVNRNDASKNGRKESGSPNITLDDEADAMVKIKQTYNFAGKVHSVEKLVPRNSAEAKLFLSSQPTVTEHPNADIPAIFVKPKRPTKKAHRSAFEPISELPVRTDLHFGVRKGSDLVIVGQTGKDAKKLNTVEKSAMDWAGFVDKEGIKEELDAAGKSKGAYRARQEFLDRVEQKKQEDARRARGLPV